MRGDEVRRMSQEICENEKENENENVNENESDEEESGEVNGIRSPSHLEMDEANQGLSHEAKERSQRLSLMQSIGNWASLDSKQQVSAASPSITPILNQRSNQNIAVQRGTIARVLNRFSSSRPNGGAQSTPSGGGRHSLLRMFSTKASTKPSPVSSQMGKRMLTCGQLSDLFRRLDKDGNGELDLEEFTQIITKLKINASEDFVARIFRKVDVAKSGTLDLQEFVSAYQMIFTRPSSFVGNNLPDKKGRKVSEYVCGVRYGLEMDRAVYELYFGTVVDLAEGPYLQMDEKRVYKITNLNDVSDMDYEVSPGWTATLGDINEMIVRDSMNNKMGRSKIYWWLDIAMVKVASCRVDKYIAALGLPNDSKFRSAFGQFGTCLPKEEKSHVYAGNGNSNLGGVSSLSFFVQALWILSLPIVHHMPAWLDTAIESYCTPSLRTSIKNYYYSRFAFLLSTSFSNSARAEEFASTYETAQAMADRLDDDAVKDEDDEDEPSPTSASSRVPIGPIDKVNANILLPAPPARRRQSKWATEPTWLIAGNELKKRAPRLQFNDLGLHLLNQGHGTSSLITIREIDNEKEVSSSSTSHHKNEKDETDTATATIAHDAKCGIIGRILTNVRISILKNLSRDGIVAVAGELTDSPGALAVVIMTLIQSFSMNTQGSLDRWLNLISTGVDELAVSKHSAHAKELGGIINLLRDYVEPTHELFNKLYKEGAQTLADEALAEEQAALLAEEEALREEERLLGSIGSAGSSSSSGDDDDDKEHDQDQGISSMSSSIETIPTIVKKSSTASATGAVTAKAVATATTGRRPSVLQYSRRFSQQIQTQIRTQSQNQNQMFPQKKPLTTQRKSVTLRRRTGLTSEIQLSFSTLSPGVETVPINFAIIRGFFGNAACQNLGTVLDGDESLEVKGTKYWSEQLGLLADTFEKVKEDIRISLDEKRNFFSFILTTVTVGLAPLTILTGYWGMNFNNMAELDPTFIPDFPGVKLMWVTSFFVYCLFMIMSIHFRIIYSAT